MAKTVEINIHELEHTWICSPAILHNEDKVLRVHVQLARKPELDANGEVMKVMTDKARDQYADDYVNKKILKIEGLSVGKGKNKKKITTFSELVASGVYAELVTWCLGAIQSERLLSMAEVKN